MWIRQGCEEKDQAGDHGDEPWGRPHPRQSGSAAMGFARGLDVGVRKEIKDVSQHV